MQLRIRAKSRSTTTETPANILPLLCIMHDQFQQVLLSHWKEGTCRAQYLNRFIATAIAGCACQQDEMKVISYIQPFAYASCEQARVSLQTKTKGLLLEVVVPALQFRIVAAALQLRNAPATFRLDAPSL